MGPIKIDYKKCIGCKKCYDLCPQDIYVIDKETGMPKVVYEDECWLCGICWMECPKRAIDIRLTACFW
ncbi:MAG: ferredoxin family protein [Parasporobacterium sp.]|nr:ferredoxin family protein [Parasporobacterium sp.]